MCVGNRNNSHSFCVGNRFNVHSLCLGTGFNIHSLCRGNRFNIHSLCIGNRFNAHSLPFHGEILSCTAHASVSTGDHDDDREHGTNKGLCRDLDEADLGRLLSRLMIDGDCRRHVVGQITLQSHTHCGCKRTYSHFRDESSLSFSAARILRSSCRPCHCHYIGISLEAYPMKHRGCRQAMSSIACDTAHCL